MHSVESHTQIPYSREDQQQGAASDEETEVSHVIETTGWKAEEEKHEELE